MSKPDLEGSSSGAELVQVERRRVQALVAADLAIADELHANDFQLITPGGHSRSKAEYLDRIASGATIYRLWEPDEISVRASRDIGCVRYRPTMTVIVDGRKTGPRQLWHTDFYEKRSGRWQVVWSQATAISKPDQLAAGTFGPRPDLNPGPARLATGGLEHAH